MGNLIRGKLVWVQTFGKALQSANDSESLGLRLRTTVLLLADWEATRKPKTSHHLVLTLSLRRLKTVGSTRFWKPCRHAGPSRLMTGRYDVSWGWKTSWSCSHSGKPWGRSASRETCTLGCRRGRERRSRRRSDYGLLRATWRSIKPSTN